MEHIYTWVDSCGYINHSNKHPPPSDDTSASENARMAWESKTHCEWLSHCSLDGPDFDTEAVLWVATGDVAS